MRQNSDEDRRRHFSQVRETDGTSDNRHKKLLIKGENFGLSSDVAGILIEWWTSRGVREIETSIFFLDAADQAVGPHQVIHSQADKHEGAPVEIVSSGIQRHPTKFESMIHFHLSDIDSSVTTLSVAATVIPRPNASDLSAIEGMTVTLVTHNEVVEFPIETERLTERSLILMNIYRRGGNWKVRAVGQGFAAGITPLARSYGIQDFAYDETIDPQTSAFEQAPEEYRHNKTPFAAVRDGSDVETTPNHNGASLAVDAWIDYVDAAGQPSRRLVYIDKLIESYQGGFAVTAFCTHRNASRTFLLSRIKSFTDASTGEIVGDVEAFLIDAARTSPRFQSDAAVHALTNYVIALSFIARADGSFQKREKVAIAGYVIRQRPEASEEVVLKILNGYDPSSTDFQRSLKAIKGAGSVSADFWTAVSEIERATKKSNPIKEAVIRTVREKLG